MRCSPCDRDKVVLGGLGHSLQRSYHISLLLRHNDANHRSTRQLSVATTDTSQVNTDNTINHVHMRHTMYSQSLSHTTNLSELLSPATNFAALQPTLQLYHQLYSPYNQLCSLTTTLQPYNQLYSPITNFAALQPTLQPYNQLLSHTFNLSALQPTSQSYSQLRRTYNQLLSPATN